MSNPRGTRDTAAMVRGRLAALRMTVRELSDVTGIGYSALQHRVRGEIEFTVAELYIVAEALQVPAAALLPARDPGA
jgi:transcriptional regulator with XRE-family HTH domain